ncbi:MAG: transcription elongation factor GreA [Armatimonadetes bacterium]|nr:transcription elongation factor GreA [Armatimonadota bacterium]
MSNEYKITATERKKLEDELTHLRSVEMPALAERIREARDLGDLSENFDYQDSKRQQGFIGGRMKDIEAMLDRATIVEEAVAGSGIVGIGSEVLVRDDFGDEDTFVLMGSSGNEVSSGKISATSPVGVALMGKIVGDKVSVSTPGGKTTFEILAVK